MVLLTSNNASGAATATSAAILLPLSNPVESMARDSTPSGLSDSALFAIADAITSDEEVSSNSSAGESSFRQPSTIAIATGNDTPKTSTMTLPSPSASCTTAGGRNLSDVIQKEDLTPAAIAARPTSVVAMVPGEVCAYDISLKQLANNAAYRRVMDTIRRNRPKTTSKVNILDLCAANVTSTKCKAGDTCSKLHLQRGVTLDSITPAKIHFSAPVSSLDEAPFPRLPSGTTITVWNSAKTKSTDLPSETLYATRGARDALRHFSGASLSSSAHSSENQDLNVSTSTDSKKVVQMQHCSHFQSGMCTRAEECNFIHTVTVGGDAPTSPRVAKKAPTGSQQQREALKKEEVASLGSIVQPDAPQMLQPLPAAALPLHQLQGQMPHLPMAGMAMPFPHHPHHHHLQPQAYMHHHNHAAAALGPHHPMQYPTAMPPSPAVGSHPSHTGSRMMPLMGGAVHQHPNGAIYVMVSPPTH